MNRKLIGERIRKLREERGQSMAYVARQIGVSYRSMCSYEYGVRCPSDPIKRRIAHYFDVTVETIFFDDDNH